MKNKSQSTPSPNQIPATAPVVPPVLRLAARLQRYGGDIAGVLLLALGLMTLVGLAAPGLSGGLLAGWANFLRHWLGWGSGWVVVGFVLVGLALMLYSPGRSAAVGWRRVYAIEAAAFFSLIALAVLGGMSLDRAERGLDGGRIGWALAYLIEPLWRPLGVLGRGLAVFVFGGLTILFMLPVLGVAGSLAAGCCSEKLRPLRSEGLTYSQQSAWLL